MVCGIACKDASRDVKPGWDPAVPPKVMALLTAKPARRGCAPSEPHACCGAAARPTGPPPRPPRIRRATLPLFSPPSPADSRPACLLNACVPFCVPLLCCRQGNRMARPCVGIPLAPAQTRRTAACPAFVLLPPGLLKAFRGHLGELLRHPAGTHVVDDLWAGGSRSGLQAGHVPACCDQKELFSWAVCSPAGCSCVQALQGKQGRESVCLLSPGPHSPPNPDPQAQYPRTHSASPRSRSCRHQAAQPDGRRVLRQGVRALRGRHDQQHRGWAACRAGGAAAEQRPQDPKKAVPCSAAAALSARAAAEGGADAALPCPLPSRSSTPLLAGFTWCSEQACAPGLPLSPPQAPPPTWPTSWRAWTAPSSAPSSST